MKPAPCRMADASMAPNISPPGSRSLKTTSAVTVDAATRMASSGIDGGPAAMKRAIRPPPSTVSPK